MDLDKTILNIPQLKQLVKNTIADCRDMLNGEIRTVGLREKIENRLETLEPILTKLVGHQDIKKYYTDCSGCGADLEPDALTCYCDDCI